MSMNEIPKITPQSSLLAEQADRAGPKIGASISEVNGKIYDVDMRDFYDPENNSIEIPHEHFLMDVHKAYDKVKTAGAGITDEYLSGLAESVFSSRYSNMLDVFNGALKKGAGTYIRPSSIAGAASETTTAYQTARRAEEMVGVVGKDHIAAQHNALEAYTIHNSSKLKFTPQKRDGEVFVVQKKLGDNQTPQPVRETFSEDTFEIFADGLQHVVSMRETVDNIINIKESISSKVLNAFNKAKDEKAMVPINALTGGNDGDWTAKTGDSFDIDAAAQVQTRVDAIKSYGGTSGNIVGIFAADSLRYYRKNNKETINPKTTEGPNYGPFSLLNNPEVGNVFVNQDAVAGEYTLVAKESYGVFVQSMKVQTTHQDQTTPGRAERRFWFDFNEVFQRVAAAASQGQSVGA